MIVNIIQARMGSSRLPGKVLFEVNGIPLLKRMYDRVIQSSLVDKTIIATTEEPGDDIIETFCRKYGIEFYRGSEDDVLDRYYQAAMIYNPEIVVRMTSDCPLADPEIIDKTIKLYIEKRVDYAANTVPPEAKRFPDGSDVEVFSFLALKRAWQEATDKKDREHVTFYFWKRNNGFSTALLDNEYDWGNFRITVDYIEDFEVVDFIFKELEKRKLKGTIKEIIELLENNSELSEKNSRYTFGMNW